jgi:hypothetical protein
LEQGIVQMTACSNNGGCDFPGEMLAGIRSLSKSLTRAINSERASLSEVAIELLNSLSTGLGPSFAPLLHIFLPTLLGLCARTNQTITMRAKTCIFAMVEHTRSPSVLPLFAQSFSHKASSVRLVAAEGVLAFLNVVNYPAVQNVARVRVLEDIIKTTAGDASVDVRKAGTKLFEAYKTLVPGHAERFVSNVFIHDVPYIYHIRFLEHLPPVLKRRLATTTSQVTSRVPSGRVRLVEPAQALPPQATGRQAALLPLPEQGPSSRHGRNQREDVTRPFLPTIQRLQRVGEQIDEKPPVGGGSLIPTAPQALPQSGGADLPRAIRKTRPPPFKPTRRQCLPSNDGPVTKTATTISSSSPAGPRPSVKVEHLATRVTSPVVDRPRQRGLTLDDLRTTSELEALRRAAQRKTTVLRHNQQAAGQHKPVRVLRGRRPMTKGFKPVVKAPSGGSTIEPLPSRYPHQSRRIPRDACHPSIDTTASRCTSKAPSAWPIQHDDPFAPSQEMCSPSLTALTLERLKRVLNVPRRVSRYSMCMGCNNHTRDCMGASPSPCGVNAGSNTPTAHLPRNLLRVQPVKPSQLPAPRQTSGTGRTYPLPSACDVKAQDPCSTTPTTTPPRRLRRGKLLSSKLPLQMFQFPPLPVQLLTHNGKNLNWELPLSRPQAHATNVATFVSSKLPLPSVLPSKLALLPPPQTRTYTPVDQPILDFLFTPSGKLHFSPQASSTPLPPPFKQLLSSLTSRLDRIVTNTLAEYGLWN